MKYSGLSEETKKTNHNYIVERWKQLYGLETEWAAEGIKYLLLVNAGATIAMLAFHGSVEAIRYMLWPKVMLGFFVFGVILVGFLHIYREAGVASLFQEWQNATTQYYDDTKDFTNLVNEDTARSSAPKLGLTLHLLGYLSFACFVIGILIGMCNFYTLTSEKTDGSKETTKTTTTISNNEKKGSC